ncbi:FliM/FliN family flagellar motor switch protein [Parvularcula sp. LCG005]|uniref:FliM/FliN family flagellar motor switch protein n=1 Tax=Parvularcula sp. LCG005 TaxID=3078805 RepID=UPI002941FACE|nr:FliM/FliN family flagellar motor switch protein [Parvularcula sp. LCG005]WOI52931.1 FliM/FliN family flagellar motor switch protein [Parvularcula sp. LCG005]
MSQPTIKGDDALPPALQGLPLTLVIRVGTARRTVSDLMALQEGSLIVLDARIDDPVEICIEDRVIARGDLIEAEDGNGLAVRLTEMSQPEAS